MSEGMRRPKHTYSCAFRLVPLALQLLALQLLPLQLLPLLSLRLGRLLVEGRGQLGWQGTRLQAPVWAHQKR